METAFKSIKYMFLFFICLSDFVCAWRPDGELTSNILLPQMILTSEMQKHQWSKMARAGKFCSGLGSRFWKPAAYILGQELGIQSLRVSLDWAINSDEILLFSSLRLGCPVSGSWAASGLLGQSIWPGARSQPLAFLRASRAQARSGL